MDNENFINNYLDYVGETECPTIYHRWCCISMIGAYLGRQYSFKFGHSLLNTNLYTMLIGTPGARKSTAIKIAKKVIRAAGYDNISADRSTKEKFLLDLAGEDTMEAEDILDKNIWGNGTDTDAREMFIACDEFNDFIGNGNIEFISLLGNLWDFEGSYENRIKNGKSVNISNPTISILGGNTPVNFARAFPSEILGQGFFSRLLLIHGQPTGKRITFPAIADISATAEIVQQLGKIKTLAIGCAEMSPCAKALVDKIYKNYKGIDDIRFESYSNRRLTHLFKLCLIASAARFGNSINESDIIWANTILSHTEYFMPMALGEFGKGKNSDTTHKVMQILYDTNKALSMTQIWALVCTDMDKINDLSDMMRNLSAAGKIQAYNGGFLPVRKVAVEVESDTVDYNLLTKEEREMSK